MTASIYSSGVKAGGLSCSLRAGVPVTPNIPGREAQPLPRHAGVSSSGVSSGSSPREGVNVAAGGSGGLEISPSFSSPWLFPPAERA